MHNQRKIFLALLIGAVLVSFLLHFRIFETDLIGPHAWRQTATHNTASCFYEEDNSILNPRGFVRGSKDGIQRQEFPLFQWTLAQFYRYGGGYSLSVMRGYCFAIGLITWLGFYLLLRRLVNEQSAIAGAVMFMFSPLFYYYMINPLPDLLALACTTWSLAIYTYANQSGKGNWYFAATLLLTLAVLVKLPYIVFAGVPLGLLIIDIRKKAMKEGGWKLLLSSALFIPAIAWYVFVLPDMTWNPVVAGVFSSAETQESFLSALIGNLVSQLPELFLNYASVPFFLIGLWLIIKYRSCLMTRHLPYLITGILVAMYFFYEIKLIGTVHDYYMLPFIPLLFIIAAIGWQFIHSKQNKGLKLLAILLVSLTPFTAYLRIDSRWDKNDPGFPVAWLKHRDALRKAAPEDALAIMGSDISQCIMPYYMHKRGWTYTDKELSSNVLHQYIGEGARYLYTDCEFTLNDTTLRPYLKKEILVAGTVHVFELQR